MKRIKLALSSVSGLSVLLLYFIVLTFAIKTVFAIVFTSILIVFWNILFIRAYKETIAIECCNCNGLESVNCTKNCNI
jgi:hypothetical protein